MFPYLFSIGSFQIRIYSLMYLLAIIIVIYFARRRGKALGVNPEKLENMIVITFLSALLFARAYYVILSWDYYRGSWYEVIAIWHGGLAIHGGVIGAVVGGFISSKMMGIPLRVFGDLIAPLALLGQGIGRFGNFANGEAHGVPTIIPPDIIFRLKNVFPAFWQTTLETFGLTNSPEDVSRLYQVALKGGKVMFEGKEYVLREYVSWGISFSDKYMPPAYREFGVLPVHPTFFYEMFLNFLMAGIMLLFWKRDDEIGKGRIIGMYMVAYAFNRAVVTVFRADDLMIGALRAPHLASLAMVIIGALIIWYGGKKHVEEPGKGVRSFK